MHILDNILDIKPFTTSIIIGTLFKEQGLKPSILNNLMGVLGQNKFMRDEDGEYPFGKVVGNDDKAIIEDKSGRIEIKKTQKFNFDQFSSGSLLALKGQMVD